MIKPMSKDRVTRWLSKGTPYHRADNQERLAGTGAAAEHNVLGRGAEELISFNLAGG